MLINSKFDSFDLKQYTCNIDNKMIIIQFHRYVIDKAFTISFHCLVLVNWRYFGAKERHVWIRVFANDHETCFCEENKSLSVLFEVILWGCNKHISESMGRD